MAKLRGYDTIKIGDFDVLLLWKDVKNITLRWSRKFDMFTLTARPGYSKEQALKFLEENYDWLVKTHASLTAKAENKQEPTYEQMVAFQQLLPQLTHELEVLMGTGHGIHYTVKQMSTRWGSCLAQKRRISLSWRLAIVPEECRRYVIIHELAHLFEQNHSPKFWAVVEKYCPNYLELRRNLRNY